MSNVKTCVATEIKDSFWGMIPLPTSNEIRNATNIAKSKVPSNSRSTLKYNRVVSQLKGQGGIDLNAGSSYNLKDSGIPGTAETTSTAPLSLSTCCGTKKNPPQGLGSGDVYIVKRQKNAEIRTVPKPSSQQVINNFIFDWEEPDLEYLGRVYNNTRSWYVNEMSKTKINSQRWVNLRAKLQQLNSLWRSKNYQGMCSFAKVPYRSHKNSSPLHQTTTSLLIFKKTNSEDITYKNVWRCYSKHKGHPCCEQSSSSSSSCNCVSQTFCDDFEDCQSFQSCIGNPNCAYSPKGCCVDDCTEPCSQFGPPCSEPGATCIDNCCWEGDCRYGPWDKTPADIPCNIAQPRSRILLRGSSEQCQDTTEIIVGTKDCTSGQSFDIDDLNFILENILLK